MDIGTAARMALEKLAPSTISSVNYATKPTSIYPRNDDEARALKAWIDHGNHPRPETVTREQFGRHLQFMAATLPFQNLDEAAARDRISVYFQLLGGYTNAAMAYLARRACAELQWFPVPAQCIAILKDFPKKVTERDLAVENLQAYAQFQMETFHEALRTSQVSQEEIDEKPEQWKRISEEMGLLRRHEGGFVYREDVVVEREPIRLLPAKVEWSADDIRMMGDNAPAGVIAGWYTNEQMIAAFT